MNKKKNIILTGDSPTGNLHIGHYFGSIKKRVELQKKFKQYIIVADYQALFNRRKIKDIKKNTFNIIIEYLSLGIDPKETTIFIQTSIPEINEFYIFLLNFVSYERLIRNPTIKKEIRMKNIKKPNMGFLTYPISQSADILSFLANYTIVGIDQKPIIEQCNEISKKINSYVKKNFFKKCKTIFGSKKKLMGIYGKNKMSKSLKNSIDLNSSEKEIIQRVRNIYTDPNRTKKNSPGNTKGNIVFDYLELFTKKKDMEILCEKYKIGTISDSKLKEILKDKLINFIKPIKKMRNIYNKNKDYVIEVIKKGNYKARNVVKKNLSKFKEILGFKSY